MGSKATAAFRVVCNSLGRAGIDEVSMTDEVEREEDEELMRKERGREATN